MKRTVEVKKRKLIRYKDIIVRVTFQGSYDLEAFANGVNYHLQYMGHTKRYALSNFYHMVNDK